MPQVRARVWVWSWSPQSSPGDGSLSQPGRFSESDHEHHRVLDLILAEDDDGAERVMREHVRPGHRAPMAGMDKRLQQG